MPPAPGRTSALHGLMVVLFSCLVPGVLHTIALTSPSGEKIGNASDATRVAHSGGVSNGLLAIAFGAAAFSGVIKSTARVDRLVATGAWFNSIAYTLGSISGRRGLGPVCFTKKSPFVLCLGEYFFANPIGVVANALFVFAALFVTYALGVTAWMTACEEASEREEEEEEEVETPKEVIEKKELPSGSSAKNNNSRSISTTTGKGSHVALIRTVVFFGAITIPSVILHFLVNDEFHDAFAAVVFGKKEIETVFPNYRSPQYRPHVAMHLWSGAAWMILSVFQLSIRSRSWKVHRVTGWIALAASVVCLIGLTVFLKIGFSLAEKFAAAYFGSLWLVHLVRGFFQARCGDYAGHARSMVRAIGISFGVGLIRLLYIPFVLLELNPTDLRDSREFFGAIFWIAMSSATLGIEAYVARCMPKKKK